MNAVDPLGIARILAVVLDDLGIPYMVGGSVASAYHGEPRSTVDLDLVIDADEAQARGLAERIAAEFYVDAEDAVDAVRRSTSFNVIHYETSTKVDIFVAERRPAVREQFDRHDTIDGTSLSVYTAEDIIVQKLHWFRLGNEVSERQWRDVIGVLRMRRGELDDQYLARAAQAFGVGDLLDRAIQDADN